MRRRPRAVTAGATPRSSGPPLLTVAATVDGVAETGQGVVLPMLTVAPPSGLALVNDTADGGTSGRTSDGRLRFSPVAGASGYEYSLTGADGTYLPVDSP